jgi:hypothetical protein
MTHIWQGLQSGEWLTAARARGYSLMLLALCTIVFAGWIAMSDGLIDRMASRSVPIFPTSTPPAH